MRLRDSPETISRLHVVIDAAIKRISGNDESSPGDDMVGIGIRNTIEHLQLINGCAMALGKLA